MIPTKVEIVINENSVYDAPHVAKELNAQVPLERTCHTWKVGNEQSKFLIVHKQDRCASGTYKIVEFGKSFRNLQDGRIWVTLNLVECARRYAVW